MSTNAGKNFVQQAYAQGVGTTPTGAPVISTRDPGTSDNQYPQGKFWINAPSEKLWYLNAFTSPGGVLTADWNLIAVASGDLNTLTGDSGGAVSADADANINILGGGTLSVAGDPGTNTLTINPSSAGYPITPFVVGPTGQAGYTTIQSAINAASAAGGGTVYVQYKSGGYTEDLTLAVGVDVTGVEANVDGNQVVITGVHTPPTASGVVTFRNINFYGTTAIFNSASAGECYLVCDTCNWILSGTGYVFNLPNWTGPLSPIVPTGTVAIAFTNCGDLSTGDSGTINNSAGGGVVSIINSYAGSSGATQPMLISGQLQMSLSDVFCPITISGGTGHFIEQCGFHGVGLTVSGASTGYFANSNMIGLTGAAFTMNSSADWSITTSTIDSSTTTPITGTGSGTLQLGNITFLDGFGIDDALTYSTASVDRTGKLVLGPQGNLTHTVSGASIGSTLEVHSSGNTDLGAASIHRHTNTAGYGAHLLNLRSRGTHGTPLVVQTGDVLSRYTSTGYGGSTNVQAADIRAEVDTGTISDSSMPGRWIFSTTPDGSAAPVEGLRLSQDKSVTMAGYTANNIPYFGSGGLVSELTLTDGQLVIGATGGAPAAANITAGTGISVANGTNSITISSSVSGYSWNNQGSSTTAAASNGYISTAAITMTLPSGSSLGDTISFIAGTADALVIDASGTDVIQIAGTATSAGGTATSTSIGDSMELVSNGATPAVWYATGGLSGTWTTT